MSPLVFVIAMNSLHVVEKGEHWVQCKLGKDWRLINPLLFMGDLMLYGRSEEELESLINVVQVFFVGHGPGGVWV